jgi:hypothetical protein
VFHYLFDFGDDWRHRIRVESVLQAPAKRKYIKMVKTVPNSAPSTRSRRLFAAAPPRFIKSVTILFMY